MGVLWENKITDSHSPYAALLCLLSIHTIKKRRVWSLKISSGCMLDANYALPWRQQNEKLVCRNPTGIKKREGYHSLGVIYRTSPILQYPRWPPKIRPRVKSRHCYWQFLVRIAGEAKCSPTMPRDHEK